ncbi:MAG: hypothetical protein AAGJ78_04040 [Pseudomonadota bacterium]
MKSVLTVNTTMHDCVVCSTSVTTFESLVNLSMRTLFDSVNNKPYGLDQSHPFMTYIKPQSG